ncbi:uncharacterized protein LOC128041590 [Gossypium raimondii]|uniref:uncharacterized protein LOC128041590 n=1 Tax=Gossypium raimondii TaxID=29730 RepID=UPI00227C4548|nr:uncharacterized protein LOC128041590 [Gossypium raimondii]
MTVVEISRGDSTTKAVKVLKMKGDSSFVLKNYRRNVAKAIGEPGSIIRLFANQPNILGFWACKDGYRAGCRRIVGLDGCFLKGYYGGYLLATVGIDANNDIYPLAYAAVESENQASWLWFLELLAIDLEIVSLYQISVMSDKQKGLLEVICMLFPNAETRHCVRHLHANFKKIGFRIEELKDLLWNAARASTTKDFQDAMDELKKTNQHAYDLLKEKNPTHWSRPHFSIRSHSDMLVNNLSESFNKMILEARGKPILTMMETIRTKIMLLIVKKKE